MASGPACARRYEPRRPEDATLHRLVERHLPAYLREACERERPVPEFVEDELRAYLRCGVLRHGFLRVSCEACRKDRLVPFSCKGRGVCPSCGGRRMAETAAHLVDRVIPRVPVRQWVLSVPPAIRYLLAYDSDLRSAVLNVLVRAVAAYYRQKAAREHGVSKQRTLTGAVTAIQRFGGGLNLNPHYHSGFADGVWTDEATPRFFAVSEPTREELDRLTEAVARRILRLLHRRGRLDADGNVPAGAHELESPELSTAAACSIRQADEGGWGVERVVAEAGGGRGPEALCARAQGFSLHAGVLVPRNDRKRLEHLLRYMLRPGIVDGRLCERPDGKIAVELKTKWRDGTSHLVLTPRQFMQRLVALIPAPRANLTRYHGVFAPHHKRRAAVVPRAEGDGGATAGAVGPAGPPRAGAPEVAVAPRNLGRRRDRYDWATLLRRVFEIDVTTCPDCGGRMRILAAITQPAAIARILDHLGIDGQADARAPPETAGPTQLRLVSDEPA